MIIAALKIQTTPAGIVVEQLALTDQANATKEERIVAAVMDIGLRVAQEFVALNSGSGTMIEGKDIEQHVEGYLRQHHTKSFREQMENIGYKLPPQR
jgi:primosomal replication protein N